jgi:hypothetical protein
MANLKHVGRIKSTGKRVVVAYRTLPGDAYSALVIPTEGLTDSYHTALIGAVESAAGQEAYEFAEAMDRVQTPDGYNMLHALHRLGKFIKISTSDVEMIPAPGAAVLLSELNQIIAEQRGIAIDDLSIKPAVKDVPRTRDLGEPSVAEAANKLVQNDVTRTTSASINSDESEIVEPGPNASPDVAAKFYRSQADKLAKQAAQYRRMAEDLVPIKKKA